MEENCLIEKKKIGRRKSDFVLGRRKSRGRSSCYPDLIIPDPTENLPDDQRLKRKVLACVKSAAQKIYEELSKEDDEQALHVLVAVEETCSDIDKSLEEAGILSNAVRMDLELNNKGDMVDEQKYLERLTEECQAWDSVLLREQKALASSEKALQKINQSICVPYSLDVKFDSTAVHCRITECKKAVEETVTSLSHCADVYEKCLERHLISISDQEEIIRTKLDRSLEEVNIVDVVRSLIHQKFE